MYGRRTIRRGRPGAYGGDPNLANQAAASGGGGGGGFWKALGEWLLGQGKEQGEKLLDQGTDKLLAGEPQVGTANIPSSTPATSSGPRVLTAQAGHVSTVDLMNYRPRTVTSGGSVAPVGTASGVPWWGWALVAGGVVAVAVARRR